MKILTMFFMGILFLACWNANASSFQYISPVPGSTLNARNSAIIIRYGDVIDKSASDVSRLMTVTGSKSGLHRGNAVIADDSKTILFNSPNLFFTNEDVFVNLFEGLKSTSGANIPSVTFSFKITPLEEPIIVNQDEKGGQVLLAVDTIPSDFPKIKVDTVNNPAPGKIFLTNYAISASSYLILLDSAGKPFKGKKSAIPSFDFKLQPNGWMSYQQPLRPTPVGNGWFPSIIQVVDTLFNPIDSFQCTNGYTADLHEFLLLPNGHVFMFSYDPQPVDMSLVTKKGVPNAIVIGAIIQELDSKKNLVFQWRSWDHIPITQSYMPDSLPVMDYVHINAIEIDDDDNIMISCRHLNSVIKINHLTGDIMWHLGGKHEDFTYIGEHSNNAPTYFAEQHDIRRQLNGNITLFDNGNLHVPEYSRGVEYQLDEVKKTAKLIWEFEHTPPIQSKNQGSVQRLSDGSSLICWGGAGSSGMASVTEVDSKNQIQLELTLPMGVSSGQTTYRAYKFPWLPGLASGVVTKSKFQVNDNLDFSDAGNTTGVKINVQELTADPNKALTVEHYDWAPIRPEFNGKAPHVVKYRVMLKPSLITQAKLQMRFNLAQFPWIKYPDKYSVYQRDTAGSGVFVSLPTTYDQANNELVAATTKFGEFIFGMTVNNPSPTVPVLLSPANGQKLNKKQPVSLQWTAEGYVLRYHLQLSTDAGFNTLIKDDTSMKVSVFSSNFIPPDQNIYWRVRCFNDAGWGGWSEIRNFIAVAPYITIITPNGGEKFGRDSINNVIRWNTNLTDYLQFDLYRNDTYLYTISNDTFNIKTGAWWWIIPNIAPYDSTYKIKIFSQSDATVSAMSANNFSIVEGWSGVEEQEPLRPEGIVLNQNFPNPFSNSTTFGFRISREQSVKLKIFDMLGREVETLINESLPPGKYEADWKPKNSPEGIYFYKLMSGGQTLTKTMILLK